MEAIVSVPAVEARRLLANYEARIAEHKDRVAEIEKDLEWLEAAVDQLRPAAGSCPPDIFSAGIKRSKKGENSRLIQSYLHRAPDGASVTTISKHTGIKIPSVQTALNRSKNIFANGNGLWKVKQ